MTLSDVFQMYNFQQLWSPSLLMVILAIGITYVLLTGKYQDRFSFSWQVKPWQRVLFLIGIATIYFAQGSPLNVIGHHYMFSVHMFQMALMYMVVPPLMLLGTPTGLFKYVFSLPRLKKVLLWLTSPLVALFMFFGFFSFYHLPIIFDAVMSSHLGHLVYYYGLFVAAFFMWWPILSPLGEETGLSELRRIAFIISGSVLITPVCVLVIFANSLLFETYAGVPQLFSWLPPYADQQLGAVLMKIIQEGAYGLGLIIIFVKWLRHDQSRRTIDPMDSPVDVSME